MAVLAVMWRFNQWIGFQGRSKQTHNRKVTNYYGDHIKKNGMMGGSCSTDGKDDKCISRPRRGREDNIKIDSI